MIRGVIFDMDGVLVDTETFYENRRRTFLQGKGYDTANMPDLTGYSEQGMWQALVPENEALRAELMAGYRAYRENRQTPFAELLDREVTPLFHELKQRGLLVGIASSSDRAQIEQVMHTAAVESLVDFYISGEECAAPKPSPEIYTRALAALGLAPGEAIAVEDSQLGIAAAKAAGLTVYALAPKGAPQNQSAANGKIQRLSQVLEKL